MMKKRLTAAALALCLTLSLLPISAWAEDTPPADPGWTEVDNLKDLCNMVETAERGDFVYARLTADLSDKASSDSLPNLLIPEGCEVFLDLNTHTISLNAHRGASANICVKGTLTVEDSQAKNQPKVNRKTLEVVYTSGKIKCQPPVGGNGINVEDNGAFVLKSGSIEQTRSGESLLFLCGKKAEASIAGGCLLADEGSPAILLTGEDASLKMTGGVLKGRYAVSTGDWPQLDRTDKTSIQIDDGALIGTECGIKHSLQGDLTIKNGSVFSFNGVGIQMNRGTLKMESGYIELSPEGSNPQDIEKRYIEVDRSVLFGEETVEDINKDLQITLANSDYAPKFSYGSGFHWEAKTGGVFEVVKNAELTFDYGDGSSEKVPTDEKGVAAYWPSSKWDKGRVCEKWSLTEGGDPLEWDYAFNGDTTLYAIWEPIIVEFVVDPMDGTAGTAEVAVGEDFKIAKWPTPEKTGYVLDFWSWTPYNRQPVSPDEEFRRSVTLYAQWKQITVTFINDGTTYKTAIVTDEGKVDPLPSDPKSTDANFSFIGWSVKENGSVVDVIPELSEYKFTADTTLYAVWQEAEKVTVTFDPDYDGAPKIESREIYAGKKLTNPPTPAARGGHTFKGWRTDKSSSETVDFSEYLFKADTTLYALWNPIEVTFKTDGETDYAVETVGEDNQLPSWPANPEQEGFTFLGWYTALTGGSKVESDHKFTDNATLYARWEAKKRTVSFDPNYTGAPASSYIKDRPANADGRIVPWPSAPTRTDYLFSGWFFSSEGTGEAVTSEYRFTADATILYARWDPILPSTITFHLNYENAPADPEPMVTGSGGKLSALPQDPVREGYIFSGWYTAASGGSKVTDSYIFTTDTDVYAQWAEAGDPNNPEDPSNPDDPSSPSNPDNPGGAYHRVYVPDHTSGGSFSVSASYAYENTRVTIKLNPRSNYELDKLEVTSLDTGRAVRLTEYYADEYIFTMPNSDVQVEISYQRRDSGGGYYVPAEPVIPMTGWYYQNGRIYTAEGELMSDRTPLTRDMLLSILFNREGGGAEGHQTWATRNNIVPNYYEGGFYGTDKPLSREQTAMILYCYARYKSYNTAQRAQLTGYSDCGEIRPMAQTAMSWARGANLMTGTTSTTLSPAGSLTCGQACVLLSRFAANVSWGW